jgi:signal transduction histidine kinase
VEKIFQSSKLMAISIDDFLNVARIEQGRMKYDIGTFDLCVLVKKAAEELEFVAQEKGLSMTITCPENPCYVRADQGKSKQIITNIVDNAIKYTPKGSIAVSLEVRPDGEAARVIVKDTGIGLSADDLSRLFQKFGRADNANRASVNGTGLGLYIAKQMTKAMGGAIWIESEGQDKGSTTTIELPKAEAPQGAEVEKQVVHQSPTFF